MNLSYLGIENFRIFKNKNQFYFKPITLLTGTNSSGKTTLIQALLLLKKYFYFLKSPNDALRNIDTLQNLSHEMVDERLGDFSKLVNQNNYKKDEVLKFYIPCELERINDNLSFEIFLKDSKNSFHEGELQYLAIKSENKNGNIFSIEKKAHTIETYINLEYFLNEYRKVSGEIKLNSDNPFFEFEEQEALLDKDELNSKFNSFFDLLMQAEKLAKSYLLKIKNLDQLLKYLEEYDAEEENRHKAALIKTYFLKLYSEILNESKNENDKKTILYYSKKLLENFCFDIKLENDNTIQKVFTLLSEPKSLLKNNMVELKLNNQLLSFLAVMNYNVELVEDDVPDWAPREDSLQYNFFHDFISQNILSALQLVANNLNKIEYLPSIRNIIKRTYSLKKQETEFNIVLTNFLKGGIEKNNAIMQFLNKYIKIFEIGDSVIIKQDVDSLNSQLYILDEKNQILLADLGYGISQFLPILLKICIQANYNYHGYKKDDSTLIIEEPETNLHPALQSKIADMLVDAMNTFNIHFIIETHSEYLIRKLQYLVATSKFNHEDLICYYFEKHNISLEIKTIEINEFGGLTDDFGSGFFDESTHWKFELIKLNNSQNN